MNHHDIATLDDMKAYRATFLESPGVSVDHEFIFDALEMHEDAEEDEMLALWFDGLVTRFEEAEEFTLFRHMTVDDFDGYVAALDAGTATLGSHWSSSEETSSPGPEQSEVDVMIRGRVDRSQIDWFSTFQQRFCHPHEDEIVFTGPVRVESIRNMQNRQEWHPTHDSYPTFCEDIPFVFQSERPRYGF
jgi:hypothetical protein